MKKLKMITIGLTSVTLCLFLSAGAIAQSSAEQPGEEAQQDGMVDHAAMHEKHMQQMRSATTNEDTPTSGTVTFADSADGFSTNNFALSTAAGNGTAAIDSDGNWSYTPTANFNGADSFVVQVTDDDGNVETQTINIIVN